MPSTYSALSSVQLAISAGTGPCKLFWCSALMAKQSHINFRYEMKSLISSFSIPSVFSVTDSMEDLQSMQSSESSNARRENSTKLHVW